MENKIRQLRKGTLELAILGILYRESHYGYSLVRALSAAGGLELKEGTVYPLLGRLAQEGLVRARWVESRQGPPRKYYALTAAGQSTFEALHEEFRKLARIIEPAAAGGGRRPRPAGRIRASGSST